MSKLSNILSSVFFFILIIQFIPSLINIGKSFYDDAFNLRTKVGVIYINGAINGTGSYINNIKCLFKDDSVKAILLRIESPGGASGSSQAIFNEILSYKKEYPKPVITLVNDICASGGYYIACASDHIICSPMSIIGSIGSYIAQFNVKDFLEKHDVKYNVISSGKYKTVLSPFTETTQEMNQLLQAASDDIYNQFKKDVAEKRKLSLNTSDKWANGKFFTGKQAFELGLVDELGSEYNAVKKIKELALIEKDKKIDWIKAKGPTLTQQLFGSDDENISSKTFMNQLVDSIAEKFLNINLK